jgi:hypothetical protein
VGRHGASLGSAQLGVRLVLLKSQQGFQNRAVAARRFRTVEDAWNTSRHNATGADGVEPPAIAVMLAGPYRCFDAVTFQRQVYGFTAAGFLPPRPAFFARVGSKRQPAGGPAHARKLAATVS